MAREIKFRAQADDGKWVVGDLHLLNSVPSIQTDENIDHTYSIDEKTIGMFTGLKYFNGPDDKKGTEVYEGDIIASGKNNEIRHVIAYHDADAQYVAYYSKTDYCGVTQKWINKFKKVVIGNIYDNPELLNKED